MPAALPAIIGLGGALLGGSSLVVGGLAGALGISTAFASGLIGFATMGLQAAASALFAEEPKVRVNRALRRLPDGPTTRFVALGRIKIGGDLIWWDKSTVSGNLYQLQVLSYQRSEAIQNYYLDGEEVTLDSNGWVQTPAKWQNIVRIQVRYGAHTSIFPILTTDFAYWNADDIGLGLTLALITQKPVGDKRRSTVYPNTLLEFSALLDGALLPDPAGGADAWSRNSAKAVLWHLLNADAGYGLDPAMIDMDSFTDYAVICNQDVALKAGGTEKRYQTDGVVDYADDRLTTLLRLLVNCDADLYITPAGLLAIRGYYPASAGSAGTVNVAIVCDASSSMLSNTGDIVDDVFAASPVSAGDPDGDGTSETRFDLIYYALQDFLPELQAAVGSNPLNIRLIAFSTGSPTTVSQTYTTTSDLSTWRAAITTAGLGTGDPAAGTTAALSWLSGLGATSSDINRIVLLTDGYVSYTGVAADISTLSTTYGGTFHTRQVCNPTQAFGTVADDLAAFNSDGTSAFDPDYGHTIGFYAFDLVTAAAVLDTADIVGSLGGGGSGISDFTVTDEAIISWSMRAGAPEERRYNSVIGIFLDPDANYSEASTPPRTLTLGTYEAENAYRLALPFCTSKTRAQRLTKRWLFRLNPEATGEISTFLHARHLGPGDWITMGNTDSLVDSECRVTSREADTASNTRRFAVTAILPEYDVWDETTDELDAPSPPAMNAAGEILSPPVISATAIDQVTIAGALAARIQITHTPQTGGNVVIEVEHSVTTLDDWEGRTERPASGNKAYTSSLAENVTYDVRARYVTNSGGATDWTVVTGILVQSFPTAPSGLSLSATTGATGKIVVTVTTPDDVNYFRTLFKYGPAATATWANATVWGYGAINRPNSSVTGTIQGLTSGASYKIFAEAQNQSGVSNGTQVNVTATAG